MSLPHRKNLPILAALLTLGTLLYGNSLGVPWYFDDFDNIVNNAMIADLETALAQLFAPRGVAYLSFALNYALSGLDVFGFHLVNILLHVGNAFLVYLLLRQFYPGSIQWPLGGALLFLTHPVQTQAVTYIVQRMTSLSCFFFLAAVLLFIAAMRRRDGGVPFASARHLLPYGLSLTAGLLAAFSKENTVVLPLVLLAVARLLRPGLKPVLGRQLTYVAPFLVVPVLAGLAQLTGEQSTLQVVTGGNVEFFILPDGARYSTPTLAPEYLRWRYLATEFVVFWLYLKLLVAPFGLVLDYCYPLAERFFNLRSLLAFGGLLGVGLLAFFSRKRSPLVLFGVCWFFITVAIESTFFPLDPIYEHRLYLPMVGVAIVGIEFMRRLPARPVRFAAVALLLVFSVMTVQRNAQWGDPIGFWEDNVARVSHSYRPKDHLAVEYFKAKRYEEALALWQEAIRIHPRGYSMHENMAELYSERGMYEEAKRCFETAIRFNGKPARLYSKLGALHATNGNVAGGIRYLEKAVALQPEDANLVMNLGSGYYKLGQRAEAEALYRRAVSLEPRFLKARVGLGFMLYEMGRYEDSFVELERAKAIAPRDASVLYYYALVGFGTGRTDRAREAMTVLETVDPQSCRQLANKLQSPPTNL